MMARRETAGARRIRTSATASEPPWSTRSTSATRCSARVRLACSTPVCPLVSSPSNAVIPMTTRLDLSGDVPADDPGRRRALVRGVRSGREQPEARRRPRDPDPPAGRREQRRADHHRRRVRRRRSARPRRSPVGSPRSTRRSRSRVHPVAARRSAPGSRWRHVAGGGVKALAAAISCAALAASFWLGWLSRRPVEFRLVLDDDRSAAGLRTGDRDRHPDRRRRLDGRSPRRAAGRRRSAIGAAGLLTVVGAARRPELPTGLVVVTDAAWLAGAAAVAAAIVATPRFANVPRRPAAVLLAVVGGVGIAAAVWAGGAGLGATLGALPSTRHPGGRAGVARRPPRVADRRTSRGSRPGGGGVATRRSASRPRCATPS